MAQSQPFLGRLQTFYGWYIQVTCKAMTTQPYKQTDKIWTKY